MHGHTKVALGRMCNSILQRLITGPVVKKLYRLFWKQNLLPYSLRSPLFSIVTYLES